MSDLVKRLRDLDHGFDRNESHTEDRYVCLCEHLANEAADAIERLTAEVSGLKADIERHMKIAQAETERAERAEAERDSLRDAITEWAAAHGAMEHKTRGIIPGDDRLFSAEKVLISMRKP